MELTIKEIQNRGDAQKEYVVLTATADTNTGEYLIADTTYTEDGHVSSKFRHTYWFPRTAVKKGDTIVLLTRKGDFATKENTDKTKSYFYYWGSDASVWNNTGDCAVLVKKADHETKKVGS